MLIWRGVQFLEARRLEHHPPPRSTTFAKILLSYVHVRTFWGSAVTPTERDSGFVTHSTLKPEPNMSHMPACMYMIYTRIYTLYACIQRLLRTSIRRCIPLHHGPNTLLQRLGPAFGFRAKESKRPPAEGSNGCPADCMATESDAPKMTRGAVGQLEPEARSVTAKQSQS